MMTATTPWAIGIFTARESIAVLATCMRAAQAACVARTCVIDVLVNGNAALAAQAAKLAMTVVQPGADCTIRVWLLALGDKAHAWNQYVHHVWPGARMTFFIDGYAEVFPDALGLLADGMAAHSKVLCAAAVPSSGRRATVHKADMLANGGVQGALFALSSAAMATIRADGLRLPVGLYRTDALIGALVMYSFDPARYQWDRQRILVHPDASYLVRKAPVWTWAYMVGQFKRRMRQAQGDLENRATRAHLSLARLPPAALARTVDALVSEWICSEPQQARRLFWRHPLTRLAARQLMRDRDWSLAAIAPQLLVARRGAKVAKLVSKPGEVAE